MQLAPAFVDTSTLIAAAAKRDQNHTRAVEALQRLLAAGRPLFTTNYVLAEAYTLARRRIGHVASVRIATSLMDGGDITLVHVREEQERRASELLRRHADKAYSFADATSFIVMQDRNITEAFTFDEDFAQAGFMTIPPAPE